MEPVNIKLNYLYRDYSNYKQFNSIVFSNPSRLLPSDIETEIRGKLINGQWFIAKDWNLPDMHFKQYQWDYEVDHNWHEFESVELTPDVASDNQSIDDFLLHIRQTKFSII